MAELHTDKTLLPRSWTAWYKDPLLILTLSIVFCLDQVTKAVVRHSLLLRESIPSEGPFRITHTFNTGSAFGLFPDQTLFLIVGSFVGIGVLLLVYGNHPSSGSLLRLSLGMQLGGAVGNLLDRVRMGQVTDFIELGFWPVFNLADASIVIGILILAWLFLFSGRWNEPSPGDILTGDHEEDNVSVYSPRIGDVKRLNLDSPGFPELADHPTCPICDSSMWGVPDGWRCSGCGVKEWVEGEI